MTDVITFGVLGLAAGSVYGLAGAGLVLTYKTSGIFNFAHGAVAAGVAYLFFELHQQGGMPWPLAVIVCLAVAGPVLGLLLERLARALVGISPAMTIVATVGLMLTIQGIATARYGSEARHARPFLPDAGVSISGARVGVDQLIVVVLAGVATVGMALFLRRTRTGLAMRAVVDDPALLDLAGTSPTRVRRVAWIVGATFAGASGILIAPSIGLDAVLLTFLVVQAFGAAAVGRFSSLGLTYAGGLAIGVGGALATRYLADIEGLAGLPASLPFLVLFVALVLAPPRQRFEARPRVRSRVGPTVPAALRWPAVGAGALTLVAIPALVGSRLPVYTNAAILVVAFLSLSLLVNGSGQVSLCHAAFAALGATTFSHLTAGAGLPWLVALMLAGLAVVPLGALVAVPASRLSGIYLALATFGLAVLLERMAYGAGWMFGAQGTRTAPRPDGLTGDTAFYYVCLGTAAAAGLIVVGLRGNRLGRLLQAMGDAPLALSTLGTTIDVTRVLVFCVSAVLAGVAGALFAALSGSVATVTFAPLQSLLWLAVLGLGGRGLVSSAVVAAVFLAVLPSYGDALADHRSIVFGAAAVVAAVLSTGRLGRLDDQLGAAAERAAWRRDRSPVRARTAAAMGTGR